MSKYVIGENKEAFDIEDALTITKGEWSDGNISNENRLYRFVTADNDGNKVELANEDSYICGVTVRNDSFLGIDKNNAKYCVVQSLGVCIVEDDGTLVKGDKCMPFEDGKATKSDNNLGYRVVERVDANHVKIIVAPNNDMIQRIKSDVGDVIKFKLYRIKQTIRKGQNRLFVSDLPPLDSIVYINGSINNGTMYVESLFGGVDSDGNWSLGSVYNVIVHSEYIMLYCGEMVGSSATVNLVIGYV